MLRGAVMRVLVVDGLALSSITTPRTNWRRSIGIFAQADKEISQKTAPFKPVGWGKTMLDALAECIRAINRFPYEGEDSSKVAGA